MKRFSDICEEGKMDVNMANVLMLLSTGINPDAGGRGDDAVMLPPQSPGRVFECKTCKRQFPSFQALGGHRASHKKPRLLADQSAQSLVSKPKTHECSICGLEFAIGQALGGHMRRHRGVTSDGMIPGGHVEKKTSSGGGTGGDKRMLGLDLNMPPMENDAEIPQLTFTLGFPLVVDS